MTRRHVTPERSSSFYPAFLLLSGDKREALSAVYAFCRAVDDSADADGRTPAQAAAELQGWREELERVYTGAPRTPVGHRLGRSLERFRWPKEAFLALIEGVERDVRGERYDTYARLEGYMDGVAGSVGRLSIEVFGWRKPSALVYARKLAHAFQLTNILRDFGRDLAAGRVYLPGEDVERFGLRLDDLRRPDERFDALVRFEAARVRSLYSGARAALEPEDRASTRPAEAMAGVYEALLARIEREPRSGATLGPFERAVAAGRGLLQSFRQQSVVRYEISRVSASKEIGRRPI